MGTGISSGTPGKKDRRSVNSSESAKGSGEEKGDEGYKSDDTADMSAIPPDQNNQNESLESMDLNENEIGENGNDSNGFLSDSDIDRASEKKGSSGSGKKGRKDSRSGSRSSSKPNRRVSFGEGTKEHMEGEGEGDEEGLGEGVEDDGLPVNESFAVEFDDDNNGTDDNVESSGLGSRRSSVSATPVSRSRVSSSSGGKYSMGETPGSNEFTR